MIKNFDYNKYTDKDGNIYNQVSLFEALQQSVRYETSYGDEGQSSVFGLSNISGGNAHMEVGQYIPNKGNFNIQAALTWAQHNCCVKSQGKCAKYVRSMIDVGFGTDPNTTSFTGKHGRPGSAYQYATFLPKIGFKHIASLTGKANQAQWSNSEGQPGDISVMAHGKHGHICMWTGRQWVSDFVQNNMWPYKGDGLCEIFRYETA